MITEATGKELIEWNRSGAKIVEPPTDTELFEKFDAQLKECTNLEELKTCYLEVVANKSALGENFYKSLASLKNDMKASIEGKTVSVELSETQQQEKDFKDKENSK